MSPVRILQVANRHDRQPGLKDYALQMKVCNGFVRNGHDVVFFSDRDVARCSNPLRTRKLGVGAANRRLVEAALDFEPDLVAFCQADVIHPETFAEIRARLPHVRILHYFIEPLFIEDVREKVLRYAPVVDRTFLTTAGDVLARLAAGRSPMQFMPNPVDPSTDDQRCHERSDQAHDVFFAGARPPWIDPEDLRNTAPDLIRERLPKLRCAFHGPGLGEAVWGAAFKRAVGNARIGLNFSQRPPGSRPGNGGELYMYSSDRIGLYLGNGLLVFATAPFSLGELYGPDALVEVDGPDDLIEKLAFYADHDAERRRVARIGYERAHAEFNERLVAQYLVEATLGEKYSHAYAWPTKAYGP